MRNTLFRARIRALWYWRGIVWPFDVLWHATDGRAVVGGLLCLNVALALLAWEVVASGIEGDWSFVVGAVVGVLGADAWHHAASLWRRVVETLRKP